MLEIDKALDSNNFFSFILLSIGLENTPCFLNSHLLEKAQTKMLSIITACISPSSNPQREKLTMPQIFLFKKQ